MFPVPIYSQTLAYILIGMCLATIFVMWGGKVSFAQAGWRLGGWRSPFMICGWGGALALVGIAWLRFLLQTGRYLPITLTPSAQDWLIIVMIAPIVEELFFRGAVFGALQRTWHPFWAIIISATFSMICLPIQLWAAFVLLSSIGYAIVFRVTGSVVASFLAHALVAAVMLFARMHPFGVSTLPSGILIKAAGFAMVCIIIGSIPSKKKSPQ